jgi:hypothetical protein
LALLGALVLAAAILVARTLDRMWTAREKGTWNAALSMAASCILLCGLIIYVNPNWIGTLIPMLGAAAFGVLSQPLSCFWTRKRQVPDNERA